MIFGVAGTLRSNELCELKFTEVHDRGDLFFIEINGSKNEVLKRFTINTEFYDVVKKYISLRPGRAPPNRFFVGYRNGKCTIQPVGLNTFYEQSRVVANYLGLMEHRRQFSGHSLRRTSASMLAEAGASIEEIKCAGGWKTDKSAREYVEFSVNHNKKIGQMIANSVQNSTAEENFRTPFANTQVTSDKGTAGTFSFKKEFF